MAEDSFDWRPGADGVVFPTEQGIAVHENGWGEIVIRQETDDPHEGDSFVRFPKHRAAAVIAAITRLAGIQPRAVEALRPKEGA